MLKTFPVILFLAGLPALAQQVYEKEVLPGTPSHGLGGQYSKDLSQSVLEDALKNIAKLNP